MSTRERKTFASRERRIYNANSPDNENGFIKAAYTTRANIFDSKALIGERCKPEQGKTLHNGFFFCSVIFLLVQ